MPRATASPEHVDVELRAHRQELVLSVSDDGVGFDPRQAHLARIASDSTAWPSARAMPAGR